jgi:hypothetical protein
MTSTFINGRGAPSQSAQSHISQSRTRELNALGQLALQADVENLRKKQW